MKKTIIPWSKALWWVVILTTLMMAAAGFYFQRSVMQINHQIENLQSHD